MTINSAHLYSQEAFSLDPSSMVLTGLVIIKKALKSCTLL